MITESAQIALTHLSRFSDKKSRVLWMDKICLTQADITERGIQVQIMDQIFQQASKVLVWMGPADEKTLNAFPLMIDHMHGNGKLSFDEVSSFFTRPS